MMPTKNVREIGSEKKEKKDLVSSVLRFRLSRTLCHAPKKLLRWLRGFYGTWVLTVPYKKSEAISRVGSGKYSIKAPPKAHTALQSRKIPLSSEWFSAVHFDNQIPFSSFKNLTMFFHTNRRYFQYRDMDSVTSSMIDTSRVSDWMMDSIQKIWPLSWSRHHVYRTPRRWMLRGVNSPIWIKLRQINQIQCLANRSNPPIQVLTEIFSVSSEVMVPDLNSINIFQRKRCRLQVAFE